MFAGALLDDESVDAAVLLDLEDVRVLDLLAVHEPLDRGVRVDQLALEVGGLALERGHVLQLLLELIFICRREELWRYLSDSEIAYVRWTFIYSLLFFLRIELETNTKIIFLFSCYHFSV